MSDSSLWTSMFPATVKGAIEAGQWVDVIATAGQFPEELSFRVQLCVEELFTNVVRHGGGAWGPQANETSSTVNVTIAITRTRDALIVVLEDNGKPYDIAAAPTKPAPGNLEAVEPGGQGIKLVKAFSDELTYAHRAGSNQTVLKFLWPNSS